MFRKFKCYINIIQNIHIINQNRFSFKYSQHAKNIYSCQYLYVYANIFTQRELELVSLDSYNFNQIKISVII